MIKFERPPPPEKRKKERKKGRKKERKKERKREKERAEPEVQGVWGMIGDITSES